MAAVAVDHRQGVPASRAHELEQVAVEMLRPVVAERVGAKVGDAAGRLEALEHLVQAIAGERVSAAGRDER